MTNDINGPAAPLLIDRDNWYGSVSRIVGNNPPQVDPKTAEEAYTRVVTRSRLDDLFSGTKWDTKTVTPILEAQDFKVRDGLWVTNLGGNSAIRDEFRSRAMRIFPESEYGSLQCGVISDSTLEEISNAITLLEESIPEVWGECAKTVHLIAVHTSDVASMQMSYTPETVYLGSRLINGTIWTTADAILHESLHERTLLGRQLWRLLSNDYVESEAPSVHLPWSGGKFPDRYFTPWRLISAAHVYVNLASFRKTIHEYDSVETPAYRGRFMLNALNRSEFSDLLGDEGKELRDSLDELLKEVEIDYR